jgi:hypothetical protein
VSGGLAASHQHLRMPLNAFSVLNESSWSQSEEYARMLYAVHAVEKLARIRLINELAWTGLLFPLRLHDTHRALNNKTTTASSITSESFKSVLTSPRSRFSILTACSLFSEPPGGSLHVSGVHDDPFPAAPQPAAFHYLHHGDAAQVQGCAAMLRLRGIVVVL